MWGYLCDNIGLVLACLPSGTAGVTGSPSWYMTQPSGIPILSPVLFTHVGDPYAPLFKFDDFVLLVKYVCYFITTHKAQWHFYYYQ